MQCWGRRGWRTFGRCLYSTRSTVSSRSGNWHRPRPISICSAHWSKSTQSPANCSHPTSLPSRLPRWNIGLTSCVIGTLLEDLRPKLRLVVTTRENCAVWWMQYFYTKYASYIHPLNGPLSRTTQVSHTRKVKPVWILLEQETMGGSGIRWAVYKSARTPDR